MDTQKVYFKVEVNRREYLDKRTYLTKTERILSFSDPREAIRLWKKRRHNDIVKVTVKLFDEIPYADIRSDFGEIAHEINKSTGEIEKFVVFSDGERYPIS